MNTQNRIVPRSLINLIIALSFAAASPGLSLASAPVNFSWTASPALNAQGEPLPAAVAYGIWLTVDHGTESLVATVGATSYQLVVEPGRIYSIRVCGIDASGNESPKSLPSDDYLAPTATAVPPARPFGLDSIYPNPFNPRTVISFSVPDDLAGGAPLSLDVYDQRGRLVRRFDLDRVPGENTVTWDGRDNQGAAMPTGLYIARFVCGDYTESMKMTMVR
jgi:hypothetical protein